jgi:hypothetical protein
MPRFRYRTETLVGPWRETRLEAETDAVCAGQAMFAGETRERIEWRVTGGIETDGEAAEGGE